MLGLIMVFMAVVVYVSLYPALKSVIDAQIGSMDDMSSTLLSLVPGFIILGLIYSLWVYVIPQRERGPPGY